MRARAVIVVVLSGCGRLGFDAVGDAGDDEPTMVPSCAALPSTCGPAGTASCCGSKVVPGGTFLRQFDPAADGMYRDTTHPATVSAFRLDTYEVTVGRFRAFLDAGMGTRANPPAAGAGARRLNGMDGQAGWDPQWNSELAQNRTALTSQLACSGTYDTWTDALGANEHRPIVCITWYEAAAFCAWDGGFLPTEAESMFASAGGDEQRAFPWSAPPDSTGADCSIANYGGDNWPTSACVAAGAIDVGRLSPAGDGRWGHADLGGNVWEWVFDWYATTPPTPCDDCVNLTPASFRGLRGGSLRRELRTLRVGYRGNDDPTLRLLHFGVRCARPM